MKGAYTMVVRCEQWAVTANAMTLSLNKKVRDNNDCNHCYHAIAATWSYRNDSDEPEKMVLNENHDVAGPQELNGLM